MNWFEILKEAKTVQSQRQGMAPIDIQKPFKRVKEEENCRQKIIDEFQIICQKLHGEPAKKIYSGRNEIYELAPINKDGVVVNTQARLKINYPKTDSEKKAFCLFYDKLSKGKSSFFPIMPNRFSRSTEEKLDVGPKDYFTAWRQSHRYKEGFNYSATLYDYEPDSIENLIDVFFRTKEEVDW